MSTSDSGKEEMPVRRKKLTKKRKTLKRAVSTEEQKAAARQRAKKSRTLSILTKPDFIPDQRKRSARNRVTIDQCTFEEAELRRKKQRLSFRRRKGIPDYDSSDYEDTRIARDIRRQRCKRDIKYKEPSPPRRPDAEAMNKVKVSQPSDSVIISTDTDGKMDEVHRGGSGAIELKDIETHDSHDNVHMPPCKPPTNEAIDIPPRKILTHVNSRPPTTTHTQNATQYYALREGDDKLASIQSGRDTISRMMKETFQLVRKLAELGKPMSHNTQCGVEESIGHMGKE